MTEQDLIYSYEQILLGKKKIFSSNCFERNNEGVKISPINQRNALYIIRYAFEKILNWKPEDVYNLTTKQLLTDLHIIPLLDYIRFPVELDKNEDFFYLACLLYPNKFRCNKKMLCIYTYKKMIDGLIEKLPKNFFINNEGEFRSLLCLQYIINEYLNFDNIKDYYAFFASTKANPFLREYRLMSACELHFENPLQYAHHSLPESQRNTFLYDFYTYKIHKKKLLKKK